MSYAPKHGEMPDDMSNRHSQTVYHCSNCGVDNVLHWHPKLTGTAVCSRPECGWALDARAEIAAEAA